MANLLATGGCMALAVLLVGCATPSSCGLGGEKVVIAASDSSPPSVSVDFVMPDGKTVSRTRRAAHSQSQRLAAAS